MKSFRSLMSTVAICGLVACTGEIVPPADNAEGTTAVFSEDQFAGIHNAYMERDARYTRLVREAIAVIQTQSESQCAKAQNQLVRAAARTGMDGLETLFLAYQDCVAMSGNPEIRRVGQANAKLLRDTLRYSGRVAYQLPQWMVRKNGFLAREIRGEAAQAIMNAIANSEPLFMGLKSSAGILSTAAVREALCRVPARRNAAGEKAHSELIRQGMCGDFSRIQDMCESALAGNSAAFPLLSRDELDRLTRECQSMARGGASLGELPLDGLAGFVDGSCLENLGDGYGQARGIDTAAIVGDVVDCYDIGGSGNDVTAGGTHYGSDILGLQGPGFYVWEVEDDGTVYSATVTDDHDFLPNDIVGPGESLHEANEVGGDSDVSVDENGTIHTTFDSETKNADGSVTETESIGTKYRDGSWEVYTESTTKADTGSRSYTETKAKGDGKGNSESTSTQRDYDKDGNLVTETITTTTRSADGTVRTEVIIKNGDGEVVATYTESSTNDGVDPGTMDFNKESCQDLVMLGYVGPDGKSRVDLDAMKKKGYIDPRVVYPVPGDVDPQTSEDHCSSNPQHPGRGCNLPILCTTYVQDTCTCADSSANGISLRADSCLSANCPAGTTPVPGEGMGCVCMTEEEQQAEDTGVTGSGGGSGCRFCF